MKEYIEHSEKLSVCSFQDNVEAILLASDTLNSPKEEFKVCDTKQLF